MKTTIKRILLQKEINEHLLAIKANCEVRKNEILIRWKQKQLNNIA